jgi:hypothetical protein
MSGHRDDGTSAENKAHHPNRKVDVYKMMLRNIGNSNSPYAMDKRAQAIKAYSPYESSDNTHSRHDD